MTFQSRIDRGILRGGFVACPLRLEWPEVVDFDVRVQLSSLYVLVQISAGL